MRVHWTNTALAHLLAIHGYVAQNSHLFAERIVDRLTRRSEQLSAFPQSGRVVPEYQRDDVREVIEGSYRIIYRLKEDQVDVLAVVHTAQSLPPKL